jgi:CheY-like chemotaxis protein
MLKKSKIIEDLRNISLLIVEDGEDIIRIMDNTFKALVKNIYLAPDPVVGIELYKNHKPDIILTDIRMPRAKDGNDFIQNIRDIDSSVPIIVVSAYVHDLQKRDLVQFVMEKPIDFLELINMIDKALTNDKEA